MIDFDFYFYWKFLWLLSSFSCAIVSKQERKRRARELIKKRNICCFYYFCWLDIKISSTRITFVVVLKGRIIKIIAIGTVNTSKIIKKKKKNTISLKGEEDIKIESEMKA